jgi:hypothetical protein
MDSMTIFAITGGLLAAAMVYVVLKVRHYGESQTLADQLLKAQTETATVKKKLLGYTQYASHLDTSRQTTADGLKAPGVSVTREYVQVEQLTREKHAIKADATVIVKYAVEFALALDVSLAGLTVTEFSNGVGLKLGRPTLSGEPKIKTLSHAVVSTADLPDKHATLAQLHERFVAQARAYGTAVCAEEVVRAACKLKALEALRDSLAKQPGVVHVPAVFAEMK